MGQPPIPTLLLDGQPIPVMHPSQIASALDLPYSSPEKKGRHAWDLVTLIDAWQNALSSISWKTMNMPTPSRSRTLRQLAVNVHCPLHFLPEAWQTGRLRWDPFSTHEQEVVDSLTTADAVRDYAATVGANLVSFLTEADSELAERDPLIAIPHGDLIFSDLLSSLRYHTAFHYRQLLVFLAQERIPLANSFQLDTLRDLKLADAIF